MTATLPSPLLGNSLDNSHKICMPMEIIKASDNISSDVSQNLKQQIISGEYIDLANLLCNVQNSSSDKQTIALVQGQLIVQPKQQDIKINTIEASSMDRCISHFHKYCIAMSMQHNYKTCLNICKL